VHGALVALAPDGGGLDPVGTMLGSVLLEEKFLVHAAGIALHGERAAFEVRDEDGRDADGVVDDLSFGEAGGGVEDFV